MIRQPSAASANCGSHMRAFNGNAWSSTRVPSGRTPGVREGLEVAETSNDGHSAIVQYESRRFLSERSAGFLLRNLRL